MDTHGTLSSTGGAEDDETFFSIPQVLQGDNHGDIAAEVPEVEAEIVPSDASSNDDDDDAEEQRAKGGRGCSAKLSLKSSSE